MRALRVAGATLAVLLLTATAAVAHPAFNPNAVPVGEAVDTVLVVPHGCSTGAGVRPDAGEAVPTTRVDLQLLDGVTIEPRPVDGWDATDDGEAIVWTDVGGATTDPIELPVTLTVTDGQPGERLELAVLQECEDGSSYRWTAGSTDTPAVRLDLTEGGTGTVEVADDHGDMAMDEDATVAPTAEPVGEPRATVTSTLWVVAAVLAAAFVALTVARRRRSS